ncbi:16S rRNA (cytosine(967)-C(5))-methyltransferase RsmB [Bacillus sp. 2205SS5-2]|uniref:16S rRNA (cytosine(967)-C(5))-methyltransferase RsmB n=1 Tax=Bacillus sp. 2205SS5-2 TaxID=3109031 RepID=UPI003005FADE
MSKQKKSVREAALEVLESVEKNQAYSNLLLNSVIKKYELTGPDIGLVTELTYGTIQRKLTLDYYLTPFLKKKIESWVQQLLRLSLYQMLYLDKIPDRAVIFEAVEISKRKGHKGISGMVNGVLRSVQRDGVQSLDLIKDEVERLSVETSHPLWLVNRWVAQFGIEKTKKMCETNILAPFQSARVNVTKITVDAVVDMLHEEGVEVEKSVIIPEAIRAIKGNLAKTSAFKKGLFTIQDESSMIVAYALGLEKGLNVLDACAAPGGKTTHIAEKLDNTGSVLALDLHEHKVKLIRENADRLGLTNITTKTTDSRKAQNIIDNESLDRILVDAPCSGLGVLRRKPDIKYNKTEKDLMSLQKIQLDILDEVAPLLKKGGILVYSTCTVDQNENKGTVDAFLEKHSDFELHPLSTLPEFVQPLIEKNTLQVLPQDFGGDGFFISSFIKKESY